MELSITQQEKQARFVISGNIDENGAEEMKKRFHELNVSAIREMSFDFTGVTHIGSAGIGKLLLFYKDLAVTGGKIRIENVTESVHELFTVLKLDTIFSITRA